VTICNLSVGSTCSSICQCKYVVTLSLTEYLLGLNVTKFIPKIYLFLASEEECRLREFGNRVLRKIFEPKRYEVVGGWRKLHNEDLHNFVLFTKYNCNGQINENEMDKTRSTHCGKRNAYRIFFWKTTKKT
jgi:hypothetical protein